MPARGLALQGPLVDAELTLHMDSHLVCHSDCEGYYVPVDFRDPLYASKKEAIRGGIVGSSQALLRELAKVAPPIGIPYADDDGPSAEALEALARLNEDAEPLGRERLVWLSLYVCARASVAHGTALVFA